MKVVINACFGGFCLSEKAMKRLIELVNDPKLKKELEEHYTTRWAGRPKPFMLDSFDPKIPRNHPALVQVVEELGKEANGMFAELKVVEIPDDVEWEIEEYDGVEWVAEKHRVWR